MVGRPRDSPLSVFASIPLPQGIADSNEAVETECVLSSCSCGCM